MNIFISYSTGDRDVVEIIGGHILSFGGRSWVDYKDLRLDRDILPQISNGISASDVFLVVGKKSLSRSSWMKIEFSLANQLGIPTLILDGSRSEILDTYINWSSTVRASEEWGRVGA